MTTKFDYSLLFEVLDGKGDCYTFPCNCRGKVDPSFLARAKFNDTLYSECLTGEVGGFKLGSAVIRPGLHFRLDD